MDNFFDQYVAELANKGMKRGPPDGLDAVDANFLAKLPRLDQLASLEGPMNGNSPRESEHNGHSHHRVDKQEANKVAQQRYRERKKQRFQELEAQVHALHQELAAANAVLNQNKLLESMNDELQRKLVEKEGEIDRLRSAMDEKVERSLSGEASECALANGNEKCGGEGNCGNGATQCTSYCDVLPSDMKDVNFERGFTQQVELLKGFLKEHGLEQDDMHAAHIRQELLNELSAIVGRSCQLCQAAVRAEGVKVLDLITKDPSELPKVGMSTEERDRWQKALEIMQLSPEQQDALLLLRKSHLEKMKLIYEERQGLNLKAMGMLLPQHSNRVYSDTTAEGRLAAMSTATYLPIARCNAELSTTLDDIKDNLRREQRAVMELNCATIARVLNPLQAAKYMIHLYPQHCDALALTNALSKSCEATAVTGQESS